MADPKLLAEFDALEFNEKMILALLALIGEPVGRTAILDHLNKARIAVSYTHLTLPTKA